MVNLGEGLGLVSATKLTTFYGCPFAFYLQYIEHVKAAKSSAAAFGDAIHYMLEQFYKKRWRSKGKFLGNWWYQWHKLIPKKYKEGIKFSSASRQKASFGYYKIEITPDQAIDFAKRGIRLAKEGELIDMLKEKPPARRIFSPDYQREQFARLGINLPHSRSIDLAEIGLRVETEQDIFYLIGLSILSRFWDRHRDRIPPLVCEKKFRAMIDIKSNQRRNLPETGKQISLEFEGPSKNLYQPEYEENQHGETRRYILTGKFDRIDRVNEKIIITDYKTSKASMDNPIQQAIFHRSLQFTLYSKAYRILTGEPEDFLALYHLRDMKLYKTRRGEEEYGHLEQSIRSADERIRAQDFTPFYGFHCGWCDLIEICAERRIGVGRGISSFVEKMTEGRIIFENQNHPELLIDQEPEE